MFCFSIMESSFCFANVEFITVPATSFIDDFAPLRSVQAIFEWKKGVQSKPKRLSLMTTTTVNYVLASNDGLFGACSEPARPRGHMKQSAVVKTAQEQLLIL